MPLAPERYKVQFTADEEYVKLVEEAKALLSHAAPRATLEEIHLRAMQALVAALKKRKYATKEEVTRAPARQSSPHAAAAPRAPDAHASGHSRLVPAFPRQRGRYIPAGVRHAVFERDGARCTYVDESGQRCSETPSLEFHHLEPSATGGEHELANVTLRCAPRNALAAEGDFGRDFMEERRCSGSPSG